MKAAHSEEAVGQAVMEFAAVQEVRASWTPDQSPDMLPQGLSPLPRGPCGAGEAAARAAREEAAMTDFIVAVWRW